MNNRFKFRSWSTIFKRMSMNVEECTGNYECDSCFGWVLSQDDNIVMQSTGLLDKNGVEIFEGDIVKWVETGDIEYYGEGEVRWHNMSADYEIMCGEDFERAVGVEGDEYEVIGNIYEN